MTISKLFKELKNNGVGVELFQLGVKSNPGLCICFFFLCSLIGQGKSRYPLDQSGAEPKSVASWSLAFFFPLFFRFLFIYIQSKYALIFCLGRVTFFRLFKPLHLTVLIIPKVVDAFFTKWRNITLQPHSLLPF